MRVLVIEDDADIAESIRTMLLRAKYAVDVASDGEEGLECLLRGTYAAAIVDIVLPGRDGLSICRQARRDRVGTPLLLLTALDAVEDRIRGLDAGADDYLIKPFSADELAARLRALLRRGDRAPEPEVISAGNITLDPGERLVRVAGAALDLGATEFRLFELFARNRGITLSRTQILERIWDYDFQGSSNIVDVYVSQLRRKLNAHGADVKIATVWGVGYRFAATGSKSERSSG